MASVHLGRLVGSGGFSRVVAIKRLHANYARDPDSVTIIFDEARLAARVRHPNVVAPLDVVTTPSETFLVMEYIHGESLAKLWRTTLAGGGAIEPTVVSTIMSGVLHGLHAAHEAADEYGQALGIVHRDVSPQNILVGADGVARLLDFGVAKAKGRLQTTREGKIKGKLGYMPPEQLDGQKLTRRADIYSAAVVTWELLTGRRAFGEDQETAIVAAILSRPLVPPSQVNPRVPAAFDAILGRGLHRDPAQRYENAREMAADLERCVGIASMSEVREWVEANAHAELARRAMRVAAIEAAPRDDDNVDLTPGIGPHEATRRMGRPGSTGDVDALASTLPSGAPQGQRLRRRTVAVLASAATATVLATVFLIRSVSTARFPAPYASTADAGVGAAYPGVEPPPTALPAAQPPSTPAEAAAGVTAPQPDRKAPAPPRPPRASGSARPGSKPKECDPPFTTDEFGHRHYEPECLQ